MSNINSTIFVCQLSQEQQDDIRKKLTEALHDMPWIDVKQAVENGMSERLCNLSDTIDITQYTIKGEKQMKDIKVGSIVIASNTKCEVVDTIIGEDGKMYCDVKPIEFQSIVREFCEDDLELVK